MPSNKGIHSIVTNTEHKAYSFSITNSAMPVAQYIYLPKNVYSLLWYMEETEITLFNQVFSTEIERAYYDNLLHPRKRIEWIAVRLATQTLCHQLHIPYQGIKKDILGKPYLVDSNVYVSLAHYFPYAFAAVSMQTPIGIDIASIQSKLQSVYTKYLNTLEAKDSEQNLQKLAIYWGAKEAIYKASGEQKLSLKQDISIEPFKIHTTEGLLQGSVKNTSYVVHYQFIQDCVLTICQPTSHP